MIRRLALSILLFAGTAAVRNATAGYVDAATARARSATRRGLVFLEKDVVKWRKERKCSTCHHGTLTVFAYAEAKRQGYAVKPETAADMTRWGKGRFMERADKPRDKRPGWSMVSTPLIYFALTAQFVPGQQAISADDIKRISGHLLRHQEADGSWAWSSAPLKNRPPPFFESDEVATRLVSMALQPAAADPTTKSGVTTLTGAIYEDWVICCCPHFRGGRSLAVARRSDRHGGIFESVSAEVCGVDAAGG